MTLTLRPAAPFHRAPLVAVLAAVALAAGRAEAADFAFVSIDPASGPLAPVPGGAAATPSGFAAGNVVRVTVTCDLTPVDVPVARAIGVGYATVPSAPPAGRSLPALVQASAACKPPGIPAPAAPYPVTVAFGFSCPAHAIAETQIVRLRLTLQNTQWNPGPTRVVDAPGNFVVKCPQPQVLAVPHVPIAAPTPAKKP